MQRRPRALRNTGVLPAWAAGGMEGRPREREQRWDRAWPSSTGGEQTRGTGQGSIRDWSASPGKGEAWTSGMDSEPPAFSVQ